MHMLDCCLRWSSARYYAAPGEVLLARCIFQRSFTAFDEGHADALDLRFTAHRYSTAAGDALACMHDPHIEETKAILSFRKLALGPAPMHARR
jgi:hypothetical protein